MRAAVTPLPIRFHGIVLNYHSGGKKSIWFFYVPIPERGSLLLEVFQDLTVFAFAKSNFEAEDESEAIVEWYTTGGKTEVFGKELGPVPFLPYRKHSPSPLKRPAT
jgi:hypothetical protein